MAATARVGVIPGISSGGGLPSNETTFPIDKAFAEGWLQDCYDW